MYVANETEVEGYGFLTHDLTSNQSVEILTRDGYVIKNSIIQMK